MEKNKKDIEGQRIQDFTSRWASVNGVDPAEVVEFFILNTDASYISHGEVLTGRATPELKWVANLKEVLKEEIKGILEGEPAAEEYYRIGICSFKNILTGVAICCIKKSSGLAIIEDFIIAREQRRLKLGALFLEWIESELKQTGITTIILESSINNPGAHRFFEKHGYTETSRVFMKRG